MSNEEIKPGAVVRLLSGGPWMTVREIKQDLSYIECDWFTLKGNPRNKTYKRNSLEIKG